MTDSLDPKAWDTILKQKCGYGLLNFTHVLAEILTEYVWRDYFYAKQSSIDSLIAKSEKIKKDFIYDLRGYLEGYLSLDRMAFPKYKKMKVEKKDEDYIKEKFNLKTCFETIELHNASLRGSNKFMVENLPGLKGRHIIKKNKIFFIWTLALRKSWPEITRLLRWFYIQLKDTAYGDEIKIGNKIKQEKKKLKNQFHYNREKYLNLGERYLELFFPEKPSDIRARLNFHSIKFKKNSIEVYRIYENIPSIDTTEFRGKKKVFHSSRLSNTSVFKKPKHIMFPNRDIFIASSPENSFEENNC